MRSRRPSPDHAEAVARRLALLSAELDAARRRTDPAEDRPLAELTRVAGSAVPFEQHLQPSPSLGEPTDAAPGSAARTTPVELVAGPVAEPVRDSATAQEQVLPLPGRHAARRRGRARRPSVRPGGVATESGDEPSPQPGVPGSAWSRVRDVGAWAPAQVSVLLAGVALALGVTCAWLLLGQESPAVTSLAADSSASPTPRAGDAGEVAPVAPGAASAASSAPGAPAASGDAPGSAAQVVVHVAGKVRRPGIVVLPAGSRVAEAVQRAGGVRKGADTSGINLARVLVDGEQVLVGAPAPPGQPAAPGGALPGGTAGAGAPAAGAAGTAAPVSLNAADQALLETLPGVGPVTASAIVEWRTANGPFAAVEELLEVRGIGEATLARLAPLVTL